MLLVQTHGQGRAEGQCSRWGRRSPLGGYCLQVPAGKLSSHQQTGQWVVIPQSEGLGKHNTSSVQKVAWPGGGTQEQKVMNTDQIRSDQLLSRVRLFATP